MDEKRQREIIWQASVLAEIRDSAVKIDALRARRDLWAKYAAKD